MDWTAFETAWHDVGCRTLRDLVAAHPGEQVYAAAFHLFYGDGNQLLPPALAANTEAAVHDNLGFSTRFAAPEWRWDVLDDASETMRPWYLRLSEEFLAPATTEAEKDVALATLEDAHDAAIARVCKAMTATARRNGIHDSLPPGFAVVILEGQRGEGEVGLIHASVDPQVFPTVPGLASYLRELEDQFRA